MDDLLAVEDHGQPAQAGDEADAARGCGRSVGVGDAGGGVGAAEMGVAAEGEGAGTLGGLAEGLAEDDSSEARVEDGVEVAGDGVEGDEVAEGEGGGEGEDEFRVEEDAVEDVEVWRVGALVGEGRGWGDDGGAFAFAGELDGVVDAAGASVVGWGDDEAAGGGKGGVFGEVGDALVGEVKDWA